jgi:hypothetical protein
MSSTETQPRETVDLAFDPQFCEALLEGDKTSTIRYGLWGPPGVGNRLRLLNADSREEIGTSTVEQVRRRQAYDLARNGMAGHYEYDDVEALLSAMQQYYPDANLTPETWFTVVHWGNVDIA